MNKLITKVVGVVLGLTMATGVGVAVANSASKEAITVKALTASDISTTPATSVENGAKYVIGSGTSGSVFLGALSGTWGSAVAIGSAYEFTAEGSGTSGFALKCSEGYLTPKTANSNTFAAYGSTSKTIQLINTSEIASGAQAKYNLRQNSTSGFRWYGTTSAVGTTGSAAHLYKVTSGGGSTTINKTITGPSNMTKSVGDSDVDIASQIKVDSNTFSGCTVASSNTDAVTVSGTTLSFIAEGESTITISHDNVVDGTTTYVYESATFTVTVSAPEGENEIDYSKRYTETTSLKDVTLSKTYFSVTFSGSGTAPSYYTSGSAVRAYGGNTITVAGLEGRKVQSVTFTFGSSDGSNEITSSPEGFTSSTWTGNANSVVFTIGGSTGNRRITKITVATAALTYNVTYNANGATSGTAPSDATNYSYNASVTVKGNTGSLAKTGLTWNGWNTANDGSGNHYAANETFNITASVTLYAEWVKTLDAITAIGGTIRGNVSNAGTKQWDFSDVTVTGTLSGSTGQDVKNYVDLSTSTNIPSSAGDCTVSVTATKKSTALGNAEPLTNNSVNGEVEAPKLVYSFTITQESLLQTGISYANENAHQKSSTATCAGHDPIEIEWATNQIMKNGSDIQFQTTNGYLYNVTEIPGTITGVSVTATAQSFNTYYGNSEHPTSETTVGGKYFTVQGVGSTPKASSIVVTFEVSDKQQLQLAGTNISLDVADGAATPTITAGGNAVSGYSLITSDEHIASITQDGKIQPVGYGKATISVTKAEDSANIYLAGSFVVTVGDHSKQSVVMEFTEKTGGSSTADDGDTEWTIEANQDENDFSEVYGINYGTTEHKVSSLVLTTPAAADGRIIKNVVVEAMSASSGSTISVSVGETAFTCSRSTSLGATVTTYNFSGNASGSITITISGSVSTKYGVKSIAILYVGDEAISFASTFLGALACNSQGTSTPSFNIKEGVTPWTWALLAAEYNSLSASDKAKFAKGVTGDENGTVIQQALARYDYIVGKYYMTGLDTSFTDFMNRTPAAIGAPRIGLNSVISNPSTSVSVVIIAMSMLTLTAVGGYFFLRKKKEEN